MQQIDHVEATGLKVVSIFSGAGGMDLGFLQEGFEIAFANDIDPAACETYETNLGAECKKGDIRKIREFPKADVLVACNPCQGFSIIGKRVEDDERNLLYRQIFRCAKIVQPKYVVMENVRGLASLYKGKFLDRILKGFRRIGYDPYWKILDAKDYGAPQHRERIIIVAVRKDIVESGIKYEFPKPTHGTEPGLKPYVTLRNAFAGLRKPMKDGCYTTKSWSFFFMSRNRRPPWNGVCYTIQTNTSDIPLHPSCPPMKKAGKDKFVFTASAKKYRRLSVRECARVQTFPDEFAFLGSLGTKYRLIGNAVPPLLARIIAQSIKQLERQE